MNLRVMRFERNIAKRGKFAPPTPYPAVITRVFMDVFLHIAAYYWRLREDIVTLDVTLNLASMRAKHYITS